MPEGRTDGQAGLETARQIDAAWITRYSRRGHPALEKDGFVDLAEGFEEREILHIASADLDDIDVIGDELQTL